MQDMAKGLAAQAALRTQTVQEATDTLWFFPGYAGYFQGDRKWCILGGPGDALRARRAAENACSVK
jgi:hypothetical protein